MAKNLYEQYASIDAEIAALENKKDALRPQIIEKMMEEGIEKTDIGVGKFSISARKVWKYPGYVEEANDAYKAAKAKAESTGDATCEEVPQLRFTATKL